MKHLNHLVDSVIQHRKKTAEKNELHDLLTLMLNATDEDPNTAAKYGSKMTETQLRDEVVTVECRLISFIDKLFFSSFWQGMKPPQTCMIHDTFFAHFIRLTWTLYLLSQVN